MAKKKYRVYKKGGMIKRADGGLLNYQEGGFTPHIMINPETGEEFLAETNADHLRYSDMGYVHEDEMRMGGYIDQYKSGGYTVSRSNDRKGKTHKVTRKSDGKTEYYGHSMRNQPKNKKVKEAAEARHRAQGNFKNPFFKAYWDATWQDGGYVTDDFMIPEYKKGGINIKPENKGKFTKKANAAGMSIQEYARKVLAADEGVYDPSTRRQANFARNASRWRKKEEGGYNFELPESSILPEGYLSNPIQVLDFNFKNKTDDKKGSIEDLELKYGGYNPYKKGGYIDKIIPKYQDSGEVLSPAGDPWEYSRDGDNFFTRRRGDDRWINVANNPTALSAISNLYSNNQAAPTSPQSNVPVTSAPVATENIWEGWANPERTQIKSDYMPYLKGVDYGINTLTSNTSPFYTDEDINRLSSIKEGPEGRLKNYHCPGGQCLEQADLVNIRKVYPFYDNNFKGPTRTDLSAIGDKLNEITLDSWDKAAEILADKSLKDQFNIYDTINQDTFKNLFPMGTLVQYGTSSRKDTANKAAGLHSPSHSTSVVGYHTYPNGQVTEVIYDLGNYVKLRNPDGSINVNDPNLVYRTAEGTSKSGMPSMIISPTSDWGVGYEQLYDEYSMRDSGVYPEDYIPKDTSFDLSRIYPEGVGDVPQTTVDLATDLRSTLMEQFGLTNQEYDDVIKDLLSIQKSETVGGMEIGNILDELGGKYKKSKGEDYSRGSFQVGTDVEKSIQEKYPSLFSDTFDNIEDKFFKSKTIDGYNITDIDTKDSIILNNLYRKHKVGEPGGMSKNDFYDLMKRYTERAPYTSKADKIYQSIRQTPFALQHSLLPEDLLKTESSNPIKEFLTAFSLVMDNKDVARRYKERGPGSRSVSKTRPYISYGSKVVDPILRKLGISPNKTIDTRGNNPGITQKEAEMAMWQSPENLRQGGLDSLINIDTGEIYGPGDVIPRDANVRTANTAARTKVIDAEKILAEPAIRYEDNPLLTIGLKRGGLIPKFEFGGVIPKNQEYSYIEAEDGETVLSKSGELKDVKGKRHTNGGVKMLAEQGAYVFSHTKKMMLDKKTLKNDKHEVNHDIVSDFKYEGPIFATEDADPFYTTPEENLLPNSLDQFVSRKRGKISPADIAKGIANKFFVSDKTDDPFEELAGNLNKVSQVPYLKKLVDISEKKKPKRRTRPEVPFAKHGQYIPRYQTIGRIPDPDISLATATDPLSTEQEKQKRILELESLIPQQFQSWLIQDGKNSLNELLELDPSNALAVEMAQRYRELGNDAFRPTIPTNIHPNRNTGWFGGRGYTNTDSNGAISPSSQVYRGADLESIRNAGAGTINRGYSLSDSNIFQNPSNIIIPDSSNRVTLASYDNQVLPGSNMRSFEKDGITYEYDESHDGTYMINPATGERIQVDSDDFREEVGRPWWQNEDGTVKPNKAARSSAPTISTESDETSPVIPAESGPVIPERQEPVRGVTEVPSIKTTGPNNAPNREELIQEIRDAANRVYTPGEYKKWEVDNPYDTPAAKAMQMGIPLAAGAFKMFQNLRMQKELDRMKKSKLPTPGLMDRVPQHLRDASREAINRQLRPFVQSGRTGADWANIQGVLAKGMQQMSDMEAQMNLTDIDRFNRNQQIRNAIAQQNVGIDDYNRHLPIQNRVNRMGANARVLEDMAGSVAGYFGKKAATDFEIDQMKYYEPGHYDFKTEDEFYDKLNEFLSNKGLSTSEVETSAETATDPGDITPGVDTSTTTDFLDEDKDGVPDYVDKDGGTGTNKFLSESDPSKDVTGKGTEKTYSSETHKRDQQIVDDYNKKKEELTKEHGKGVASAILNQPNTSVLHTVPGRFDDYNIGAEDEMVDITPDSEEERAMLAKERIKRQERITNEWRDSFMNMKQGTTKEFEIPWGRNFDVQRTGDNQFLIRRTALTGLFGTNEWEGPYSYEEVFGKIYDDASIKREYNSDPDALRPFEIHPGIFIGDDFGLEGGPSKPVEKKETVNKPDTLAARNNNPLNIKDTAFGSPSGFDRHGHAKFDSFEEGLAAGTAKIQNIADGNSRTYPLSLTLGEFSRKYATSEHDLRNLRFALKNVGYDAEENETLEEIFNRIPVEKFVEAMVIKEDGKNYYYLKNQGVFKD